tara:strand:+ start:2312 stop:2866 length:555 start_codon:yes stop_codon:yes gene_type:complete
MLIEKQNFLSKVEFNSTVGQLRDSSTFPWYYSKNTAYELDVNDQELWDFSFSNTIYVENDLPSFFRDSSINLLKRICKSVNLKLKKVLRIRAGMITKTPVQQQHNPHVDFNEPHLTALFYLTTCNAPTIIYNQLYPNDVVLTELKRIDAEENKIVIFDGLHYHASTSQTDTKQRIVINFNFTVE